MSAFSSLDLFYELDERRRRSGEVDYGVWWKWELETFRLTWVEATGELIAVRLGHGPRLRTIKIATHLAAADMLHADEWLEVYVLAKIEELDDVEALLEGWADVCGAGDSLGWVLDRLAGYLDAPPASPSLSPRRRRSLLGRLAAR